MITGTEMNTIMNAAVREIMRTVAQQSHDGGDINQACKDAITGEGVRRYVYNVGNPPTRYERRYEGGGLADEKNLLTTTTASNTHVTIDIEDRTPAGYRGMINPPPDPVFYLSDIIEGGYNGPKWKDPDWPGARPYLEESVTDGCKRGGLIDRTISDLLRNLTLNV